MSCKAAPSAGGGFSATSKPRTPTPRIIDRETFDLAQRLLLERGENPAADPDRPVTVGVVHEARRAAGRGQPRSRTR